MGSILKNGVLNSGQQLIGWGTALIFVGSVCILMNVGTFVAVVGASSFVLGLLLMISGSLISITAISPKKAAQFGSVLTIIGAITMRVMLVFPHSNPHSPEMPPIYIVLALTVMSLLTCVVGLLRLGLDRRSRRVN